MVGGGDIALCLPHNGYQADIRESIQIRICAEGRNLYKPIECKEVEVSSNIEDLAAFAAEHNVTYADLKQFNLWLRDRKLTTAGKTYKILIPKESELYYKTQYQGARLPLGD